MSYFCLGCKDFFAGMAYCLRKPVSIKKLITMDIEKIQMTKST